MHKIWRTTNKGNWPNSISSSFLWNHFSLLDAEDESNLTTTKEEDMGLQKSLYLVFQSNQGCQKLTSELMQNLGPPAGTSICTVLHTENTIKRTFFPQTSILDFSNFGDFANAGESSPNLTIYSVEPGSSVNLTCLSEGPHRWTSTAPQFTQSLDKASTIVGIFYCFSATRDTATYSFIATADTWRPSGGGAVSGPASKLQFWQHSLLLYFVDQECILHVIIADTFAKEMQ